MKRIFLVWVVLIASSQAASFPCYNAKTKVEKLICPDLVVSGLDDKLHKIYNSKLSSADTEDAADAIRSAQKQWLRKRNRCNDIACLKTEYETRIRQLTSPYRKGTLPLLISEAKAEAVCKEVMELANSGRLESQVLKFNKGILDIDYNRDGKIERLGVNYGGGSCSNAVIYDLATVKKGYPPVVGISEEEIEKDEVLRWSSWGRSDYFLIVQGEPIVIAAKFSVDGADLALVSWFGEGQQRPLCTFSPYSLEVNIAENNNPELCNAVSDDDFEALTWSKDVNEQEQANLRTKRLLDKAESANIDLNIDGEVDKILLLDYSSGAGCGAYNQWLDVLQQNLGKAGESTLAKILESFSGPLTQFHDNWKNIKLFTYKDKPYLLANGPSGVGVYSVWKNSIQTWCSFRLREQVSIDKLYPPN